MGLGLKTGGGGEVKPFLKFDARAGRLFRVDRTQDATGTWVSEQVDITQQAQFVADLQNIEVGWINFSEQGPVRAMTTLGNVVPERPGGTDKNGKPAFKQGFSMQLAMPKDLGGGVREFSSTAGCVIEALDELHDTYSAAAESKAGKLPVVAIASVLPVKSGQSTNYKPVFRITAWVDRPPTLVASTKNNGHTATTATTATTAATKPAATPPTTGSTQVAAPVAAPPAQAPAAVALGDFG